MTVTERHAVDRRRTWVWPPHRTTGELAYYRCYSPEPVPPATLVQDAGSGWTVEEQPLGLRHWGHMPGYGGHFSTGSRRYSTTLTALAGRPC